MGETMMDTKKIIQELDDSLKNQHCGFVDGIGDVYAVSEETIKNIIALLKKQEKETVISINGFGSRVGAWCPNCQSVLHYEHNQLFCGKCGQAVEWR